MRSGDYAAVMFSPEFPVDIGPKLLKKIGCHTRPRVVCPAWILPRRRSDYRNSRRLILPRVINVDKNPAYQAALKTLKREGILPRRVRLWECKYLNNIVEQDHRSVKKRAWLAKGDAMAKCSSSTSYSGSLPNFLSRTARSCSRSLLLKLRNGNYHGPLTGHPRS
jgi:hypothetical protein